MKTDQDNQRLSQKIEDLRNQMVGIRSALKDVDKLWRERTDSVAGLMTCGLISLHSINEEIIEWEIRCDDEKQGKSIHFRSRGVGLDGCPGCFVCGATKRSADAINDYLHNIAAFVKSKEDGEAAVGWFSRDTSVVAWGGARLDLRPSEPKWIQVKVGACDLHKPNLELLDRTLRANHNRLRKVHIDEARA